MIKIGVIGGAGYTAGELIRVLVFHPFAEIVFVHSESNSGKRLTDVHCGLLGETDLYFTSEMPLKNCDVIFLCMGHGKSKEFFYQHTLPENLKIIDLSQDFRLKGTHKFLYGLPELNRELIKKASFIANPGCFATAIQMILLPLAKSGLLKEIHINGVTGSTGAGQKPTSTTHFSWRNNNVSTYKVFTHQHLLEIVESVKTLQSSFNEQINFVPVRGNFARGIFVSGYQTCQLSEDECLNLYKDFYSGHPFIVVSETEVDLKEVVNTNKAVLHVTKQEDKIFVTSSIDNLLKGASGQAVHNMNLMFNLEETTGLRLKSIAF